MRTAGVAGVVVAAVLVVGVAVAGCGGSSDGTTPPSASPAARRELLARLERGVQSTWATRTRFHRDTPSGPLDAVLEQLNRRPDWLTAGFGSVRGVWAGRTVDCSDAAGGKICGASSAVPATTDSDATARASVGDLRRSTRPGGPATVRADGAVRVAGNDARCFVVAPRRGGGTTTRYCLTRDGVPVRVRVQRPDSSDDATATSVSRTVTDTDFERLLDGYPIGAAGTPGSTVAP